MEPQEPIRAVVVDDEQLAREELCFQLNQVGDVEIVGQAANGPEALAAADELEPDVVFLDVQMPGLTGFEVARSLLERATTLRGSAWVGVRGMASLPPCLVRCISTVLRYSS